MIIVTEKKTKGCRESFICPGDSDEDNQSSFMHIPYGDNVGIYKLTTDNLIEKIFNYSISEVTLHSGRDPFDLEHALLQIRFVGKDSVIKKKRKMTLRELCDRIGDGKDPSNLYNALAAFLIHLTQGEKN